MYQYGNVATQYQKEHKKRVNPTHQKRPQTQPHSSPKGMTTGEKVLYLLTVIIVVTVSSLLLMRSATISQLSYDIQTLEREVVNIEDQNAALSLEVAELSSPERIERIAREEWGLSLTESTVRILPTPPFTSQDRQADGKREGES
ncbi:cell division protein FtsL [Caldalkalibacillus salinus]|uniref:cell division protein FtsL n=1 Tax=Caldalkalibacillus salinus TaxID=2803787 RepID=UPI001923C7CF|nr:cell division protein FtsL [Caldalkalibacillus salinus]